VRWYVQVSVAIAAVAAAIVLAAVAIKTQFETSVVNMSYMTAGRRSASPSRPSAVHPRSPARVP
tara:strand:- start:402 stop:593 length:192 start_codon:yes stop_codon:yes gene_type:complete